MHPFHMQIRIVFAQVIIVEGLLREEGRDDILEGDQSEALLGFNGDFLDFSEHFEDTFDVGLDQ